MTSKNVVTDEGVQEVELIRIETKTNDFLDSLRTFKVTNKETFDDAQVHLEAIASIKKEITDFWAPLIKNAFDAKQSAAKALRETRDKEESFLERPQKAEAVIRKLRLDFKTEQDRLDRIAKEKAEAEAEKKAKKEAEKLLKKAEKTIDPVNEEKLIEKADEIKVAPTFIPKTIKKSERTASGTLNTFVSVLEIEVHDVKSICHMVSTGELPVNCVAVSEAKIKAWAKAFDKPAGMYDGFNINKTEKERITSRKK
ncbi:MAG: hypothetical protein ACYSW3_20160 [Planctomycetota bacterium]